MAELTAQGIMESVSGVFGQAQVMRLYCWQCNTVHAFPLPDVEKIVYQLGAEAVSDLGDSNEPECLVEVMKTIISHESWQKHVEQGIECRKAG